MNSESSDHPTATRRESACREGEAPAEPRSSGSADPRTRAARKLRLILHTSYFILIAVGCEPAEDPPVPSEKPAVKTDEKSPKVETRAEVRPLYVDRAALKAIAAKLEARPDLRLDFTRMLALGRPPAPAVEPASGVHRATPVPPVSAAYDPSQRGEAFRRLLDDAQAARDFALAYALKLDPPAANAGEAEPTVEHYARKTVGILRRFASPGGTSPLIAGAEEGFELSVVVCTLLFAADLVWDSPAWVGADGDLRGPFCKWALVWAQAAHRNSGSLAGSSAAWTAHLRAAATAMACRLPDSPDALRADLRRQLLGDDWFGLPALLRREFTPEGFAVNEQTRPDGAGRATLSLGAMALSLRLARLQFPGAADAKESIAVALLRKGFEHQLPLLPQAGPGVLEVPETAAVRASWLIKGRHPQTAWFRVARSLWSDLPQPRFGSAPGVLDIEQAMIGPVFDSEGKPLEPRPFLPVLGPLVLLSDAP